MRIFENFTFILTFSQGRQKKESVTQIIVPGNEGRRKYIKVGDEAKRDKYGVWVGEISQEREGD